ncbi:hypothetical protein QO004_000815 [Rhizobium mesoamericanum]|nr:hypothetical protein [Rhizobium mesoamericanum]
MDNGLRNSRALAKAPIPIFEGFVRRLERESRFFEEERDFLGNRNGKRQMIETPPLRRLKIGRVDA